MLSKDREKKFVGGVSLVIGSFCVYLLQTHCIEFWTELLGSRHEGIITSLTLEALALWFWSQTGSWYKIAGLSSTTIILTCSLLYTAQPLIKGVEQDTLSASHRKATIASLEESVATLQEQNKTFSKNSETRGGWADHIKANNLEIRELKEEIKSLGESQTIQPKSKSEVGLAVLIKALTLILFQIGAVTAMQTARKVLKNNKGRPAATPNKRKKS